MSYNELWAKTSQGDDKHKNFHPIVCHLIDTAAVCQRLLQLLPAAAIQRLQMGLGLNEAGLKAWVPFLAGAHDTGKATPSFQFMDTPLLNVAKMLSGGSVYDLWYSQFNQQRRSSQPTPKHGTLTAYTLPKYLELKHISPELAKELAAIVGGHHGIIPTNQDLKNLQGSSKRFQAYVVGDDTQAPEWKQWRLQILEALAVYCGIQTASLPTACDPAAAVLLAGVTTLSDWLASNQTCFPPAGSKSNLHVYLDNLSAKVGATLEAAHWQERHPHQQPQPFAELFQNPPRGLQVVIEALMPALHGSPALIVVEAPTGEGKTEAALTVAHWNSSHAMTGAYIGMPTQATGNALYDRLKIYINRWYPDQAINLQLVHSAALLNESFSKNLCRLNQVYNKNEKDKVEKPSGAAASEWFAYRKKALLAPWGVGTIDQALVGVLRSPHQFLYLLGLAGKTIILDEVHAYDSYTSRLLDQLVHWCGILGTPVVILSATLSREQRQRLLSSYATGLGTQNPKLPEEECYPRVTVYANGQVTPKFGFPVAEVNQNKKIKISWVEESEIESYLGQGATAIVRSTVKRCQKTAEPYPDALVFHSRFTQADREAIEAECHQRYGKPEHKADPARPASLLIATQVIEQSLDVDFDVMISDFCPIDLLIQRMGRLWRHERTYRGVTDCVIYLIRPEIDENGLPVFGEDVESRLKRNHYEQRVYDRHALLRTWYLLRDSELITLPGDTDRLIEAVYDLHQPPLVPLTATQQHDWNETLQQYDNHQKYLIDLAKGMMIPQRGKDFKAYELTERNISEDEAKVFTRLLDDSITVILDVGDGRVICDRPPVEDEIRQVLRQQVRISSPGLVHAARQNLVIPAAWKEISYLRELCLLQVPTQLGKDTVHYDRRLGLRAIKNTL